MKEFKKVELHLHLDGSIRPETALELLKEIEPENKKLSLESIKNKLTVGSGEPSLVNYLKSFDLPIKILQSKKNLERVAFELIEDLAKENTIYVEVRDAPVQHINSNLTGDEVVEAILKGFKRAEELYPIRTGFILCAMRHLPPENSDFLIDLGVKYRDRGVVGLDLAGDEGGYPASIFKDFFKKAKKNSIPFTIHAGEAKGPESIREAIELGADRIGHGIRAYEDNAILDLIIKKNICLECCPVSNRDTMAIKDFNNYPILNYLNRGAAVTLNSDNRTVSNTNYIREVEFLKEYLPLEESHIKQFNINAINHAFINKNMKKELLDKLKEEI